MLSLPRTLLAPIAAVLAAALSAFSALAQDELGIQSALHCYTAGPVYECNSGKTVFFDSVPENVRARDKVEATSRASDDVTKCEGKAKIDLDMPDFTGLSSPRPPQVEIRWKRADGSEWRVYPALDSVLERGPLSPNSTTYAFGPSGKGTPAEPRQRMVLRMRGKARIEKVVGGAGKNMTLDAPYNLVVGSVTRDRETGKYKGGYEANHDLYEVKLVVPETFDVPEYGKGMTLVFTGAVVSR